MSRTILCGSTAGFVSDLVGNPKDRFRREWLIFKHITGEVSLMGPNIKIFGKPKISQKFLNYHKNNHNFTYCRFGNFRVIFIL